MVMAEDKGKAVKSEASGIAVKDIAKTEPQVLSKTEKLKAVAPSDVAIRAPSEIQVIPQAGAVKGVAKTEPAKPKAPEAKAEAPKAEAKAKKEADPSKEFVDAIMVEMNLKGASKKRLIRTLAEQYGFDKQKVMFRLRRALITERYAAAHAEAGH